jgi:acyl-CoA reductase-like NAD-dependent aldehyde dehydrogenase
MKVSHLIKDKKLLNKLFPYNVTDYLTINPKNNVLEERFGFLSSSEIQKRIKNSYSSFKDWKEISLQKRLEKMDNLAETLEKNKEVLAQVMTKEMVQLILI